MAADRAVGKAVAWESEANKTERHRDSAIELKSVALLKSSQRPLRLHRPTGDVSNQCKIQ